MQLATVWKDLIGILCPKDYGLFDEVNLAAEDPAGYFEEYQQELSERGIENAGEISVWLALIDGLLSRRCLVEVDKQGDARDIATGLAELSVCRDGRVDLSAINDLTERGTALLGQVNKLLKKHDLTLGVMSLDSDSWPLVVIPASALTRAQGFAKKLSEEIVSGW
jgi:hypothetical protein